jgi:hypothetical protein
MQNIYVWEPKFGLGKFKCYLYKCIYPYAVQVCKQNEATFHVLDGDGKHMPNCMIYTKQEIKFLHKKPLRHFIEKRQGK